MLGHYTTAPDFVVYRRGGYSLWRVSYYQTGCGLSSPLAANSDSFLVFLKKAVVSCPSATCQTGKALEAVYNRDDEARR